MEVMTDIKGFDIDRSVENLRSLMREPAQHVLVARQGRNVLGFVSFSTRKTVMHPALSGLIDELVVSGSTRGTGIGRLLIEAVVDKCRELGCCEVEASTEKSNPRARRFYKACGFEEDAVLLELNFVDSDDE